MNTRNIILLAAISALAACTGSMTRQTATEADFGKSTASLIKAQTANPAASANPSTEPVTGVDPDYANAVLGEMREAVSKPTKVSEPVKIQIGGQE